MLRRIRQLPRNERRELWPALWRLALVRLSLLASGIRPTLERCGGTLPRPESALSEDDLALWGRRALALRRVGRFLPQVHCLARSLALRWWMRSHGIHARISIGVKKCNDTIDSHAWVVVSDTPVDERPEVVAQYSVIQTDSDAAIVDGLASIK